MGRELSTSDALRQSTPAVLFGETRGWSYFDGPSGTQMVSGCIEAMEGYLRTGVSNRHGFSPAGDQTEEMVGRAREQLGIFLGATDHHIVFGQNMTSLAFSLAHALARGHEGGSVAVSELEHRGNVDPWLQAFSDHGASERWITVDPATLELSRVDIAALGDEVDLRLVAVTAASNAVGVRPELVTLGRIAHERGAVFVVDGVHATPHAAPPVDEIGADIFLFSGYKLYGPHIGVAAIRRELAERLVAYKVLPAPGTGAEKFETGSQNHVAIAGLLGTLDALATLAGSAGGGGARATIAALEEHERALADGIADTLAGCKGVRVFRGAAPAGGWAPTVAFDVEGATPQQCADRLRREGLFVTCGDFYATPLAQRLGVSRSGGWVRVGVAGYTTGHEVSRLVGAVQALAAGR